VTYASGFLHLEEQSAQRSRRIVLASVAVADGPLPSDGMSWVSASANARSIAFMAFRHFFPGFGKTATASVWNIQNTFRRNSTNDATPTLNTLGGFGVFKLCAAIARGLTVVNKMGLSPYGRVLRL
jgi:hypothetical protein